MVWGIRTHGADFPHRAAFLWHVPSLLHHHGRPTDFVLVTWCWHPCGAEFFELSPLCWFQLLITKIWFWTLSISKSAPWGQSIRTMGTLHTWYYIAFTKCPKGEMFTNRDTFCNTNNKGGAGYHPPPLDFQNEPL